MKKVALDKAAARLALAQEALERIKDSERKAEFEGAWVDFLVAVKGIHSIFEASAHPKKDPKAHGWYSRKIRERRTDPLLKYLNAARNAEEYGLEPIVEEAPGFLGIGRGNEVVHVEYIGPARDGSGRREIALRPADDGKLPTIRFVESQAKLVRVKDERFGDEFDPPMEHMGKALSSGSLIEVAELALEYHKGLLTEAETYVT